MTDDEFVVLRAFLLLQGFFLLALLGNLLGARKRSDPNDKNRYGG